LHPPKPLKNELMKNFIFVLFFFLISFSGFSQIQLSIENATFKRDRLEANVVIDNSGENEFIIENPFFGKQIIYPYNYFDLIEACQYSYDSGILRRDTINVNLMGYVIYTENDTVGFFPPYWRISVNSRFLFKIKCALWYKNNATSEWILRGKYQDTIFLSIPQDTILQKSIFYDFSHITFEKGNKYYFQMFFSIGDNKHYTKSNVIELHPRFDIPKFKDYYGYSRRGRGFFWKLKHGSLKIKEE